MIIRQKRSNNFTVVNTSLITDTRLGWDALGLLAYLLSRPDHWEVHTAQLVKQRSSGRDAVLRMLRDLRRAGYVVMQRRRDGTINWLVYDEPQLIEKQPKTDFPSEGKSLDGKIPPRENPAVLVKMDPSVNTEFFYFWEQYDLKKNQPAAERQWQQLTDDEKRQAILGIEQFKKSLPGWQTQPYASAYLRDRRWLDDLTPPKKTKTPTEKKRDLPFHDTNLPQWAAEHGYPPPSPGETFKQYRNRLKAIQLEI